MDLYVLLVRSPRALDWNWAVFGLCLMCKSPIRAKENCTSSFTSCELKRLGKIVSYEIFQTLCLPNMNRQYWREYCCIKNLYVFFSCHLQSLSIIRYKKLKRKSITINKYKKFSHILWCYSIYKFSIIHNITF